MKIIRLLIALVILFRLAVTPTYASTFSDNFDDGNADGWWLGYSQHTPWVDGNWRVEDGILVQDIGADAVMALVQNLPISNQSIQTQLKTNGPSGGCGITVWYHDSDNYILVMVSPSSGRISVGEYINNGSVETGSYYQNVSLQNLKWYNLKVDADAVTGELAVYLDDVYLYTYTASTQNRLGRSGVVTGNAGGYFDNFIITSDSIVGPPTDKTQCRKGGWKSFNNPAFKNQGACIRYIRKKSDRLPRFSRFFENFSSKFKVGWRTTR